MTTIPPERAIEILESVWHTGDAVQALIVLRRVVKDYAALKAEKITDVFVERDALREKVKWQGARMEKAEAELTLVKADAATFKRCWDEACNDIGNLKAQLEKQAPLIQAVMGAETRKHDPSHDNLETALNGRMFRIFSAQAILRAALALREGAKK